MAGLSPNAADFLPQFKAIGQSLKKRFFRKPNVADAVEQFENLCQELEREGQKEFAAVCALEAAKCQESLQNHHEHANLLLKAGKLFLDERKFRILFESGPTYDGREALTTGNFQCGIQCLRQASSIYKAQGNHGLNMLITLKMGDELYREEVFGEALQVFKDALSIASSYFTLADQLVIVEAIVKCKIKLSEFEGASKVVGDYLAMLNRSTDESRPNPELFNTFILRFEILRVCLLLINGPDNSDMAKFIWPEQFLPEDSREESSPQSERTQTMLYLKSLVLAVQHGSVDEINVIRDHLAPILTETEQELFMVLIKLQG